MSSVEEKRTVVREERVATRCDGCGITKPVDDKAEFYHFCTGHHNWGNDSHESLEWFDACSVPCYVTILKKQLPDLVNYSTAELDEKPVWFVKDLVKVLESA